MSKRKNTTNKNSDDGSLLAFIGIIVLFIIAVFVYSFAWIPAIPILIYFIKSKKYETHRVRNVSICSAVIATSLIVFVWLHAPKSLEEIQVEWESTDFVVGESINIPIEPRPSDAKIKNLKLLNNDVAELDYKDGIATLTFIDSGTANLQFVANEKISSDYKKITVITKEEKQALEEKARLEALLLLTPTPTPMPTVTPVPTATPTPTPEPTLEIASPENNDPIVYITNSGAKYHSGGCRTLKKSKIEKKLSEVKGSYEPCGICNPPQ